MILINKTLHQQNHFRGILKQIPWKKTYLYAVMEKIDEDIENAVAPLGVIPTKAFIVVLDL